MRRAILMMLFASVSSSAAAEWVAVARNETLTAYIDRATIRGNGDLVKMWDVQDYKTIKMQIGVSKSYISQKTHAEYDCKKEQYRTLYLSLHGGNMALGEIAFTNPDPSAWIPVPPYSIAENLRKLACGKLPAFLRNRAAAGWARINGNEALTAYVDKATIRRNGDLVKMWSIADFKTIQAVEGIKPYISRRSQEEYNCKDEQIRFLYVTTHSGSMAGGDVVQCDSVPGIWEAVAPGTIGETFWKFACGKR